MILDKLSHIERYYSISPQIEQAMNWLKENDVFTMPTGLHVIDGEKLKVKVQRYTTGPAETKMLEVHDKYIDIQCVLKGNEMFGLCRREDLIAPGEYIPDRDISFPEGFTRYYPLDEGSFFMAWPGEAHRTKCFYNGQPSDIVKAIFKILPPTP